MIYNHKNYAMKNNVLYFILSLLFINSQSLFGQGTSERSIKERNLLTGILSGKVIDKNSGAPMAGATIYIADLKDGAVTDSSGRYSFRALPTGNYLIEARFVGYKTVIKNVYISGNTVENFQLEVSTIEEGEVVVTGFARATEVKKSPIPIISITHGYILKNLSTNIIDAIAKIPGVNALTTGPNISKPFIRGLGYNRILTLYDGVRQEGQQWGDEHGIEVDQYSIDRIEVIKGPASLSYGSDALAGVVNLIPYQPMPEGKTQGDILAEYQTNNKLFGGSAMLGSTKNGFEWMARASHKQAIDYKNNVDGRVYNTAFNETDADATFGLHRKWGYSRLNLILYDDLQEIPDGSRDSATMKFTKQITEADTFRPIVTDQELNSYKMSVLHQHVQHYRIYSSNSFKIGNGQLIVNLGYQRSVRREFSHPEVPYQNVAGLFLQLNTYTYDVKYNFPEKNGWSATAGINGMYQENTTTNGTEFVIPSYHQFDAGPFMLAKKSFSKLDITGGIRFDTRSFTNKELYTKPDPISGFDRPVYGSDTVGADHPFYNYSHVFSGFSGSIGATYNFTNKFYVKANIANGYRAPNISEISANGVHPGTSIYQIGNKNFKPEFSFQQDIGFGYSSKQLVINLSLFNNTITNYIFNQRLLSVNGGDSVIIAGNQTYKFQQGKAALYGGEISVDFHLINALHFENSLSVVYAKNKGVDPKLQTDSNKYLPFIPPLHGISELRYDFEAKEKHIVNGFVKLQVAYTAAQNRVYLTDNTETPTAGYTLVNAGIGAGFTNKKNKTMFNLFIIGNNLFDVAYQDHLSRLKYFIWQTPSGYNVPAPNGGYGIYNMGRNIQFKIDFPLDFK